MQSLLNVYSFLMTNKAVILGALFGLSEALALIPGVQANSVFEAIVNGIKALQAKIGS